MFPFSSRRLLCLPVLLGLALPAYAGFTQLPEELFVPEFRSDRVAQVEQAPLPPRETIMSHGREVRLVGVPFLPDAEEQIDFTQRTESTWWSLAAENLLALFFDPADEQPIEVAADNMLQLADIKPLSSSRR